MKPKNILRTLSIPFLLVAILVLLAGCTQDMMIQAVQAESAATPAVQHTRTEVETHPSQGDVKVVESGHAELFTTTDGATMSFRTTDLQPGHVYSAWWVVINHPEACETSPCTAKDVLQNATGVGSDVTFGDAIIVQEDGRGSFASHLAAGEIPGGWFGNGLSAPHNAEIHVVINDHGPLIAEMATSMLTSYRGGCTDESLPGAFPDSAKADGEPGPNTCRLVQDAIFRQTTQ